MKNLTKHCADALRVFCESRGTKLKAAHAHELVAAFFGYQSKAALDSDTLCPVDSLAQADIYVLKPSAFIDMRRKCLQDLAPNLPDTYTLSDAIIPVLAGEFVGKPFASFSHLAETLSGEYLQSNGQSLLPLNFRAIFNKPLYEFNPEVEDENGQPKLSVTNSYYATENASVLRVDVRVIIQLKRVAGHVGFALSEISASADVPNFNRGGSLH